MSYELRNVMEDIVEKKINDLSIALHACPCEHCKKDALAYALNRIPPHYVVSETGDLIAKVHHWGLQNDATITSAAVQAIMTIKEHPHHSRTMMQTQK